MKILPEKYIDKGTVPLSLMNLGTEYSVTYDTLILDAEDRFWVKKNQRFGVELEDWEDETSVVYIKRTMKVPNNLVGLIVRIPLTFSKRKKWVREDGIDGDKYVMVDEIVVE